MSEGCGIKNIKHKILVLSGSKKQTKLIISQIQMQLTDVSFK
jgi:hypothetical protein